MNRELMLCRYFIYSGRIITQFLPNAGQMVVAKVLSRHYADLLLYGQCIVYYEHCVGLCRTLKNKQLEGEFLELLSNLYLSLNTEK